MFAHAVVLHLVEVVAPTVGFPETEGLLTVPPLHLLRHIQHVVGSHVMVGVTEVNLTDATDVGRHAHLVVGDAHSGPYTTDVLLSLAEDFENPHLVLVGNGEAFSAVAIAILFHKVAHQADGLTGGRAALQGYSLQFLYQEQSFLVLQLLTASDGGLADAQLFLVETGICRVEIAVGVGYLWYAPPDMHLRAVGGALRVHPAIVDIHSCSFRVVIGGHHLHPGWSLAGTTCIQVRYHESQVCEVMTDPSVEAAFPTMMLVHDMRDMPSRVISSGCEKQASGTSNVATMAAIFLVFILGCFIL